MSARGEARALLAASADKMQEIGARLVAVATGETDEARASCLAAMDGTNDGDLMEVLGYIDRVVDLTMQAGAAAAMAASKLQEQAGRQ